MADSSGARLRRNMSKIAFRSKEKVMRSFGRVEETKDEILDHYVMLIDKQQVQMQKLQRDMRQYLESLKAMSSAQKAFYNSLSEIYEDEWAEKDVIVNCAQRSEALHEDVFERFRIEVIELLQDHLTEYQQCKVRVEKRGRKLVDYDAARRTLHSIESARKPDGAKSERAKQSAQQAKEFYEELNNLLHEQLPTLYDSRLLICVKIFSSVCESEKAFSNEISEVRTNLNNVLLKLKSAFDNGEYKIQRMQMPLDNGKTSPMTGDSGASGSGSPAKIAVSSTASSTPPQNTNDRRTPPARLPDSQVPPPPSSGPSSHEYVNLQVGTNPDVVQSVSEEEENNTNTRNMKKSRPQSLFVPTTAANLSVYGGDKQRASDDGSGSADQKKSAAATGRNDQSQLGERRQSKGLLGFLGLRRKSTKASAQSQSLSNPGPAKSAHGTTEEGKGEPKKEVAGVAVTVPVATATDEEPVTVSAPAIQNTDRKIDSAAGSLTSPSPEASMFEKINPARAASDRETRDEEDALDGSGEDVDSAFAKYAREDDDGSQAVVNKTSSIKAESTDPDEVDVFEVMQDASSNDAIRHQSPLQESVRSVAEAQRISLETDTVFAEVADSSTSAPPQEFEGVGDSTPTIQRGVGDFGDDQQHFEVNFEDPMSDTSSLKNQASLDEDCAFGSPAAAIAGEGFFDSFMPSNPERVTSAADNAFGSEPFQAVLQDPDEVLKRDDSVFTEDTPISPPSFKSVDDLSTHLPEFEGDGFTEVEGNETSEEVSSESEHQNSPAQTSRLGSELPAEQGQYGEVECLAQMQPQDCDLADRQLKGEMHPEDPTQSSEFAIDIHPHAATPPNTPAYENIAFGQLQPKKSSPLSSAEQLHGTRTYENIEIGTPQPKMQVPDASYPSAAMRFSEQMDASDQDLYEDMAATVDLSRSSKEASANPLTSRTAEIDEKLHVDMTGSLPRDVTATPMAKPLPEHAAAVDEELYEDMTSGTLMKTIAPLKVNLSDDEDDSAAINRNLKNTTPIAIDADTLEFPKPGVLSPTANGGDAAVIQPIYEEPPRNGPARTTASPNKSSDGQKYIDLPPNYLYSAQALYVYRSSDDDELSFDKGEIVHIIQHPDPDDQDDGWLMGVRQKDWEEKADVQSCMGVFPENFTKRIQL